MTGELWRISGLDFFKQILKDKNTFEQLVLNIKERHAKVKRNESNRHNEFKFHNVQGKEVDSLLDSGSERYISDDEKDLKKKQ